MISPLKFSGNPIADACSMYTSIFMQMNGYLLAVDSGTLATQVETFLRRTANTQHGGHWTQHAARHCANASVSVKLTLDSQSCTFYAFPNEMRME